MANTMTNTQATPLRKPTVYFPFFGNDFFEAVAGYPDAIAIGYLRALWHYWHHTGCDGLPDDEEYLRRVCACEESNWLKTKGILFDNRYHFRLENGRWHQPRCREEFQRSLAIGEKRSRIGAKGAQARWQKA